MANDYAKKKLILVRHAHRDTSDRELDNGLSEKGREQAKGLVVVFKNKISKDGKIILFSSPKRRCIETLAPFSKKVDVKITVDPNLDEQKHTETAARFEKRLDSFLEFISGLQRKASRSEEVVIVACSHGDWLPIAIQKLTGVAIDLKKGGVAEIEDGRLVGLLQPDDYLS